jgi:hypothetical protein
MPQLTARNKFSIPLESDAPADLQAAFEGYMASGGDKVVQSDSGPLAQRPVSTAGAPGKLGRRYLATDDLSGGPNGTEYIDTGTSWIVAPSAINNGGVTNVKLADDSVDQRALAPASVGTPELIDAGVGTVKLAPKAVDTTKLADALKPSAGAGAATEAVRALGTGAGQALPGNDPSVTNARTPLAHRATHAIGGADELFGAGTLAARPAAAGLPNGYHYFVNDENGGTVYQVIGGAWSRISAGNAPNATRLDADVFSSWRDIASLTVGSVGALNTPNEYILAFAANQVFASGAPGSGRGAFYVDPADYAVPGKTTVFRVRRVSYMGGNSLGFGVTGRFRAFNLGVSSGGNDALGTVGTTAATIGGGVAMNASTIYNDVSGTFNLSTLGAGHYCFTVQPNTGPWPTGAIYTERFVLQVRNQ